MPYRRIARPWTKAVWLFRHHVLGKRQWYMTWLSPTDVHVVPALDYFVHEAGAECLCRPSVKLIESEEGDQWVTTHQSFDQRTQVEV